MSFYSTHRDAVRRFLPVMLGTTHINRTPHFVGASANYPKPDITHTRLAEVEPLMRKSSLGGLVYSLDSKVQEKIIQRADDVLATLSAAESEFRLSLEAIHWAVFRCDYGCELRNPGHFEPECQK